MFAILQFHFRKFTDFSQISVQNSLIFMKNLRNFQQIVQIRSKYARFSNFLIFAKNIAEIFTKRFSKSEKKVRKKLEVRKKSVLIWS